MSTLPLNCPLTGLPFSNSKTHDSFFQYTLIINRHNYIINLSLDYEWDNLVKQEYKSIFIAMFNNAEWPIESQTIITPDLIEGIILRGEYPKDFEQKLNHYLLTAYLEGGKEYKKISYDILNTPRTYANSPEQFQGIIDGLLAKGYINFVNNQTQFTFAEKGIEKAEELLNTEITNEPRRFNYSDNKPTVSIYGLQEDAVYYEKLKKLFLDYGFTISGDFINHQTKIDFRNMHDDYVVFLHSNNSIKHANFISLVSSAIAIHDSTIGKTPYCYLLFPFIYMGDSLTVPVYAENYRREFYDFRIVTNRKKLIKHVLYDWHKRNESEKKEIKPLTNSPSNTHQYNFPKIDISAYERIWIHAVYEKFINNEDFKYHHLLAKLGDKVSKDFDPMKINSLLVQNATDITILGIWHIYPDSVIIEKLDKVIYTIQKIIGKHNQSAEITSDQIKEEMIDITLPEIRQIFTLIDRIGGFAKSMGWNPATQHSTIGIDQDFIFRNYMKYTGVEKLIKDITEGVENKSSNSKTDLKIDSLNKITDRNKIDAYRAKISIRDTEINPVMGVVELATDLAGIIQTLPEEKGQMFGIFGKWGRGKTFLLKQLWENLSKSTDKKYIKLEYHAWKYQETPASWAYLYKLFVEDYLGKKDNLKDLIVYSCRLLKLNIERLGWYPIIKFAVALLVSIISPIVFVFAVKYLNWYILSSIPVLFIFSIIELIKSNKNFSIKAIDLIKKYSVRHDFNKSLGIQAEIQDELIKLLKIWIPNNEIGNKKILLFVEDIDRCTEDRIIQSIDALRVMLEEKEILNRVIIVTAIDERILKNAIRIKYKSLITSQTQTEENRDLEVLKMNELISEYLDKIFISAIRLGELTDDHKKEYLDGLLKDDIGDEIIKEVNSIEEKELIKKNITNYIPFLADNDFFKSSIYNENIHEIQELSNLFTQIEKHDLDLAIKDGDFVVNDGDIAMESKDGKILSPENIENSHIERLSKQKQFEKLTTSEFLILKDIIINWKASTPRKIRIFYYRYLLCKNLLINRHTLKFNLWQNEPGIKILMRKILYYSDLHEPESISLEKLSIISESKEEVTVKQDKDVITVPKEDYLHLLEALEMAIAY